MSPLASNTGRLHEVPATSCLWLTLCAWYNQPLCYSSISLSDHTRLSVHTCMLMWYVKHFWCYVSRGFHVIGRCHNTQCLAAHCIWWGCVAAHRSEWQLQHLNHQVVNVGSDPFGRNHRKLYGNVVFTVSKTFSSLFMRLSHCGDILKSQHTFFIYQSSIEPDLILTI